MRDASQGRELLARGDSSAAAEESRSGGAEPDGPAFPAASLRRLLNARPRRGSRCELCGKEIGAEHAHLLEMKVRQVACSCEECAILFGGQSGAHYRRIPRDARRLAGFEISDAEWDALGIPIGMAYFRVPEPGGLATAFYPSPAGAMESLLSLDAWQQIAQGSAEIAAMEPEVEALLVNRLARAGKTFQYYIAPIDQCYRLVGLIRSKWRGFTGGPEVWTGIEDFFAELEARTAPRDRGRTGSRTDGHARTEL